MHPGEVRRSPLWVIALMCLSSTWAMASPPELLVSVERVAPSGVEVALGQPTDAGWRAPDGEVSLTVKGGEARRLAGARLPTWQVTPDAQTRTLELSGRVGAHRVTRSLPVGAPAPEVGLSLFPAAPVKGRDRDARLTVKLVDGDGRPWTAPTPPVLRASVGEVVDVRRIGPGLFEARYVLPTTRFPEVAVIVAFAPWPHADAASGATGALRIALATEVELPGSSEPGATLTLEIAQQTFGPITVGRDGRFRVPVVVPPGEGIARSTVRDRHGNRRVERIDLRLPPVDPLACVVQPAHLPADGASKARVLCALSDTRAQPVTGGVVRLRAQHGQVNGPTRADSGLLEWTYTAPANAFGSDTLQGASRGRGVVGEETLVVTELARPAESLSVVSSEDVLHRGARTHLTVRARDAQGRPTSAGQLEVRIQPGSATTTEAESEGVTRVHWSAPLEAEGEEAVARLEAWGPPREVPAKLWAWREGDRLHLAVTDVTGLPVPHTPLLIAGQEETTDARGRLVRPLPEAPRFEVRHREWPGLHLMVHRLSMGEGSLFPQRRPPEAVAELRLSLGPPVPVDIRVEVKGRTLQYWAEVPGGERVPERALTARGSAGTLAAVTRGADGVHTLTLPEGAQLVTISDDLSGVAVAVRVHP